MSRVCQALCVMVVSIGKQPMGNYKTYKGEFKYYISVKGGEGSLTSIAYFAYAFKGVGGSLSKMLM